MPTTPIRVEIHGIAPGKPYQNLMQEIKDAFTSLSIPVPKEGNFTLRCSPKVIGETYHALVRIIITNPIPDVQALGRLLEQILNNHVAARLKEYTHVHYTIVKITTRKIEVFSSSTPIIPT